MSRRVGKIGRTLHQVEGYRIFATVIANSSKLHGRQYFHFRKPLLPNRGAKAQVFTGTICKAALDELCGALDGEFRANRNQRMKVIRHNHKIVKTKLTLFLIFDQELNEQGSCTL